LKKTSGRDIDVSRLFIYYNARMADPSNGGNITDEGSSIICALEILKKLGTCEESIWPYIESRKNERPSGEAYKEAEKNQITGAFTLDIDLQQMKLCLAKHHPFVFGLKIIKEAFDTKRRV
jgi:hypothetical protein